MVLGCFLGRSMGIFTPLILKSVNKDVYPQNLQYPLLPILNQVSNTIDDSRFLQDNSPIQKVKIGTEYFEENNIKVHQQKMTCPIGASGHPIYPRCPKCPKTFAYPSSYAWLQLDTRPSSFHQKAYSRRKSNLFASRRHLNVS